jgi:hypothetical protein
MPMDEREPELPAPATTPVPNIGLVVDLGGQRRKAIKRLKRGEGALAQHIQAAAEEARRSLGIDDQTVVVPVVLLYHEPKPDYRIAYAEWTVPPADGSSS